MPRRTKTQAADTPELPTAAELICMVENGEEAEAVARVKTLPLEDFKQVRRAIQIIDKALSSYALSWQGAEYWGEEGHPYPGDAQAA